MYVVQYGLKSKWAEVLFAVFTSVAAFGIGCKVQANSVAATVQTSMGIPTWITGLIVAALTAAVILGGLKSIAKVCNILVPFMAIFYVIGCIILLVIGHNWARRWL